MSFFAPNLDQVITRRYSSASLEYKVQNKTALQRELGWAPEERRPLLCLPAGMSKELGGDLLLKVLPGILSLDLEILIRGKGSPFFGSLFTNFTKEQGHRIAILPDSEVFQRKMYAACDLALFFREAGELPELTHALSYGAVPISPETPGLQDYDPVQEQGNSFLYSLESSPPYPPKLLREEEAPGVWGFFAALVRALETYRLPFDFRTIQRQAMEQSN